MREAEELLRDTVRELLKSPLPADLAGKHCVPCEGGMPPMPDEREDEYLKAVPAWELRREGVHRITRGFKFRDFKESMGFVNRVAELAEAEGHHPDIQISWNRVRLELTTHAVKGLSDNDFIMAAKVDGLLAPAETPQTAPRPTGEGAN